MAQWCPARSTLQKLAQLFTFVSPLTLELHSSGGGGGGGGGGGEFGKQCAQPLHLQKSQLWLIDFAECVQNGEQPTTSKSPWSLEWQAAAGGGGGGDARGGGGGGGGGGGEGGGGCWQ